MERELAEGLNIKAPTENTPEFVKARIGIRLQHFHEWAKLHVDHRGWLNIDILESRGGKWYAKLDTYKKTADGDDVKQLVDDDPLSAIPF